MVVGRREFLRYAAATTGLAAVSPAALRSCKPPGRPNILVITADDMRYDHLPFMTRALALFGNGVNFRSCRQNVSLCQPARVGFLTGQHAFHNGVYTNTTYMTSPANSLPSWMQAAGYRTAMIGKYPTPWGGSVLPGWTTQRTFTPVTEQDAYGFTVQTGSGLINPPGYQADYIADEVISFATSGTSPWFCWMTPTNPHVNYQFQLEPRPEDAGQYLDLQWPVPIDDPTDKPTWMQGLPPLDAPAQETVRLGAIGQLQELIAVDHAIERVFSALASAYQITNTIVFFSSDNGVVYGEHGIWHGVPSEKNVPYEPSMHVPLLARGPGFTTPGTSMQPVCVQDLTATCVAVAGATPGRTLDGIDLRTPVADRAVLHERSSAVNPVVGMPSGVGVTTATRKLWRHEASDPDRYEMYLLDTDPDELQNVAYEATFLDERNALEARLDSLLV